MQYNHQLLQNDSNSYTKVRYSPPLKVPQGSKHQPITHRIHRCVCITTSTYKLQSTQLSPGSLCFNAKWNVTCR